MLLYGSLFLIALSLLRTLLHNSTEFNNVFVQQQLREHEPYAPNPRVLFLTAHPDDECMFFAPTILALTSKKKYGRALPDPLAEHSQSHIYPEVFSLCLSFGNADGLGTVRRKELGRSLDVLGIGCENRVAVDHPDLKDNITAYWRPDVIAEVLGPYLLEHRITTVLTFDHEGISGHPNHRSLPEGVMHVIRNHNPATGHPRPKLFSLVTHPISTKYTSIAGPIFARFRMYISRRRSHSGEALLRSTPVFISGIQGYLTALRAMREHESQLVWFRWLYVSFSRYMWVNEWAEVIVEDGVDHSP